MLPASRRWSMLVAAIAVSSGCGTDAQPVELNPTGPIQGLPACASEPAASTEPPVDGVQLPEGAIITKVTPQGPLTTITGYLAMTPVQVRRHYQQREDLEILFIEDEIYEAEILLSDGTYRSFIKALAQCAEGSRFVTVVAPEVDAQGLPVPTQQQGG